MIGRFLYGFLFAVVLPVALVLWSRWTDDVVRWPVPDLPGVGFGLAAAGLIVLLLGIHGIVVHGRGLPMNAYPPSHYVTRGIFRWIAHPIYCGFAVLCVGVAIAASSPGGLWLVSPVVVAGSVALVLGYEGPDMRRRFGGELRRPKIALPTDRDERPTGWERASVYILVLVPWLLLYETVVFLGARDDALQTFLPWEREWPIWPWTEAIYASSYLVVVLVPLVIRSARELRRFALDGICATAVGGFIFFTVPLVASPRPVTGDGFWVSFMELERELDGASGAGAFPAFHVIWSILAARALTASRPRMGIVIGLWCAAVIGSCITTGMHGTVDILAGVAVAWIALSRLSIWERLRRGTERVANSWREWRLGSMRIIVHGVYAGTAMLLGVAMIDVLSGGAERGDVLVVALCSLVTAALWAQLIEGSSGVSLRPFGYYGSVIGGVIGCLVVALIGGEAWLVAAAFSAAGPGIMAIGRLRCLVQGCCHGRPAPEHVGIRFTHPRSRVTRLSDLGDTSIHPTQLYSILWNVPSGALLVCLWFGGTPASFIVGVYLLLSGLGRFVEESYRGEPQTPRPGGLAIYQWNAIATIVIGAAVTCCPSGPVPAPVAPDAVTAALAVGLGFIAGAAMGVDWPESSRRFSRLT